MYVCVCNAISVNTVRDLAAEGLSFEEIQALTNCSGSCGSCLEVAEKIVDQARRGNVATLPVTLAAR
jgi:bacterioferritin-associated ferredoxin